jgi:hypothetical protein
MLLKIDENLPIEAAELLRRAGHDALTVGDQAKSAVLGLIARLIPLLEIEAVTGNLWILQENGLRVREG